MKNDLIETDEGRGREFNPIPSIFTLGNAMCGLAAIMLMLESHGTGEGVPVIVLWLIAVAMLFDGLDGFAARLLNAKSMHGMHLDSLADVVSFGVAPAIIIYVIGINAVAAHSLPAILIHILPGLHLGSTLWRLAVYNTRAALGQEKTNKILFIGLPSPAAAAMICSMAWLMPQAPAPILLAAYVVYTLIVSLLMVSTLPYPNLRKLFERAPPWVSAPLGLLAVFLVISQGGFGLVILAHLYFLSVPLNVLGSRIMHHISERLHPRTIG